MTREQGGIVKKLTVQDVRVFIAQGLSYHWRQMTLESNLIKSSFSRVGLSLPIDGSKDYMIKILAAEHINVEPVLLTEEVNSSGPLDQELKPESSANKLMKQLDNNQSVPRKQKKPISVEAQRARDLVFAAPPESTLEVKAFELFAG